MGSDPCSMERLSGLGYLSYLHWHDVYSAKETEMFQRNSLKVGSSGVTVHCVRLLQFLQTLAMHDQCLDACVRLPSAVHMYTHFSNKSAWFSRKVYGK